MVILYSARFNSELEEILDFISLDSKVMANKFATNLKSKIKEIHFMPYAYPKNKIADKENIRNLIFKGYTIPFVINNEVIEILGIYKQNLWKM